MMDLAITVKGEVVASNLPAFQDAIDERLALIKTNPSNDQEFGQAETDWKDLSAVEKAIKAKTEQAMKEATALNELFDSLSTVSEKVRQVRLDLEKAVKARKEEIRKDCIEKGVTKFQAQAGILPAQASTIRGDLIAAVKGKRTIKSMNSAADVVITTWAGRVHQNQCVIEEFIAANPDLHGGLVSDKQTLELYPHGGDALAAHLGERAEKAQLRADKEQAEAKARAAKAETEQAKKAVEEKDNPPEPPKAGEITPAQEWEKFLSAVVSGLQAAGKAREALQWPDNQLRAKRFADAINAAWKELTA